MRRAFATTLAELAERDPRLLLLTSDLGFMALEPFSGRHPTRFFNVGVAEQNMVGIATGLAEAGFIPFVYSIATFATLRPYEFIRNGPILHQLPVRIIGIGGGFEYGTAGLTHHSLEDVGVMRVQPGLATIAPADFQQARTAFLKTWELPGPIYYRLGKDDKAVIPGLDGQFELDQLQVIREGHDLLFIAMGPVASEAVAAADRLAERGIEAAVAVIASINPAPRADLIQMLSRFDLAITVEAHYLNGGIGSLVAEIVAEEGIGCRVIRRGVSSNAHSLSGSQEFLYRAHGISADALYQQAVERLGIKRVGVS